MDSAKMPSENDLGIENDISQSTMDNTPLLPKLKSLGKSDKVLSGKPLTQNQKSDHLTYF
jgi:hypothetical protein